MCVHIALYLCLFIYLSIHIFFLSHNLWSSIFSVSNFAFVYFCQSICFFFFFQFLCLFLCVSLHIFLNLSLFIYLSIYPNPNPHLNLCSPISLPVYFCLSICLSLSVCPFICLSVCLFMSRVSFLQEFLRQDTKHSDHSDAKTERNCVGKEIKPANVVY